MENRAGAPVNLKSDRARDEVFEVLGYSNRRRHGEPGGQGAAEGASPGGRKAPHQPRSSRSSGASFRFSPRGSRVPEQSRSAAGGRRRRRASTAPSASSPKRRVRRPRSSPVGLRRRLSTGIGAQAPLLTSTGTFRGQELERLVPGVLRGLAVVPATRRIGRRRGSASYAWNSCFTPASVSALSKAATLSAVSIDLSFVGPESPSTGPRSVLSRAHVGDGACRNGSPSRSRPWGR